MEDTLLSAAHICKKYNGRTILNDICLSVRRGEAIALVGENGCGKSTLLRVLSGLTQPTAGTVQTNPSARLGLIPDRYEKISLTVTRFMSHMLALEKLESDAAQRYYRMFALEDMLDMPMKYLSKGTLQKVAAVQALVGQRDLLFVDEPLSGQDAVSRRNFAEELLSRKNAGTAILMAVHEPLLIETLADRIFEIRDGLLEDGTAYACRHQRTRCVFLLDCGETELGVLLRGAVPEAQIAISSFGQRMRLEADSTHSVSLLRALLDARIRIVKFEEGETPC